jgi:hypothetical protein
MIEDGWKSIGKVLILAVSRCCVPNHFLHLLPGRSQADFLRRSSLWHGRVAGLPYFWGPIWDRGRRLK